jgi:hypothetical protein
MATRSLRRHGQRCVYTVTDLPVQRSGLAGCNPLSNALSDTDEAYFWTALGATHIPVPNGEEQEISTPWFRWKLLGDQAGLHILQGNPDEGYAVERGRCEERARLQVIG